MYSPPDGIATQQRPPSLPSVNLFYTASSTIIMTGSFETICKTRAAPEQQLKADVQSWRASRCFLLAAAAVAARLTLSFAAVKSILSAKKKPGSLPGAHRGARDYQLLK